MRLIILCTILITTGCAMPKWGNKQTTLIFPDGRVYKAYVSSDGRMRYKDASVEWEVDNRGAESLPEGLARAAAFGLTGNAATAAITK